MQTLQCVHRNYTVTANVVPHAGIPLPFEVGCRITSPEKQSTRRLCAHAPLFLADLENAQRASIALGKSLVDQQLDKGDSLFE